jgi:F-type H+-transporting ATPase subunit b
MNAHDTTTTVSHGVSPGGALFSFDPGLTIWTWVVFGLLYVVLRKYAWRPMMASVRERERVMAEAAENARRTKEQLDDIARRQQEILREAEEGARRIMVEGRRGADEAARVVARRASEEAESIAQQAREQIERERERAVDEIRKQAVDLVIAATQTLVESNLDDEAHRRIVQRRLEGL